MIGRRTAILGLSLFGVLAACDFGAQGASAAWVPAINTTAYTCVKGGGLQDFVDVHCATLVSPGAGEYGAVSIENGAKTATESSNTATKNNTTEAEPFVLKGTVLGVAQTVTCKKAEPDTSSESSISNLEIKAGFHNLIGTSAVLFEECTQTGNGSKCKVKEPITLRTEFEGVEEPVTGAMAIEFKPHQEEPENHLTVVQYEGSCLFFSAALKGRARGTASGATLEFKAEDEELTFAGNVATLEGKLTTKMTGGNPIFPTTVT